MLKILTLLLTFSFQPLLFAGQQIPYEFWGQWVAQSASCHSPLSLKITSTSVTFKNVNESHTFSNVAPCFSCEGGAQYSGIVVWVIPEDTKEASFTIFFNANEVKNTALVEFESSELKSKFPLNNVQLKKCKSS